MTKYSTPLLSAFVVSALSMPAMAADASSVAEFFKKGDFGLDFRYRLENVDQAGLPQEATASTLRTKLWYKTATYEGFSAFGEFEVSKSIGKETYNNTINGKVTRRVIADPESTELNQAYLKYSRSGFTVKGGRMGINLDNQRFIGTVGWRQNDQTYDAASFSYSLDKELTATYVYVWNVNRIFSDDHPLGNLDTNSHIFNVSYSGLDFGKLTAYGYFLDMDDAPVFGLSSRTIGARFAGKAKVADGVKISYEAEYANQADYKSNPGDYSASYVHVAAKGHMAGFILGAGYELLGSDNGISFKTPLATLHKFNGFADKFLGTPAAGLQDIYAVAAYKVAKDSGVLSGLLIKVWYHDFSADAGGADYGSEIDWLIAKKFGKNYMVSLKGAHYDADGFATDTDKVWLTLGAKF